jgi:putative CocE/NonD family hydrolase
MMGRLVDSYRILRLRVAMQDGVELATDVYTPAEGGRWPVLLARTPYGKEGSFQSQHMLNLDVMAALEAGFAVVLQDTRGRGASDGSFEPYLNEPEDAWATVEWICSQPFSAGWVGMYGASYVGVTQWQAVKAGHPALRAIAPSETADSYREGWSYSGGAFQLGLLTLWMIESLAPEDVRRRARAGDPHADLAQSVLDTLVADPATALARLPLVDGRVELLAPDYAYWLGHPGDDAYWRGIDVSAAVPALALAGLHIVGLNDVFCSGGLAAYARASAAGAPAAERQHLIVGPWSHGNFTDWQGDVWLGYQADAGRFGLGARQLEFFRAVFEERPPDLAPVEYFTTGINVWRTAPSWPPPGVRAQMLYPDPAGGLQWSPGGEAILEFVSDPRDPVPTTGGATFLQGMGVARNSGPKLQAAVESRPDVVVFTSAPLAEDLEVVGPVMATLEVACEDSGCDWVVRLCDVDTDGASLGMADGIRRLSAADHVGGDRGGRRPVEVSLGAISHVFRAGHRLRLQITGSNFPRFDRNPHARVRPERATAEDLEPARQRLRVGGAVPTRVVLPVVASDGHGSC